MTERYAIYYAPPRDSRLWKLGAQWLGRDAATGARLEPPAFSTIDAAAFVAATEQPRRYGFHATLKAPMRLALGVVSERLQAVARSLAAGISPVPIGPMEVRELGDFIALTPVTQRAELTRLAADCVTYFEPLRAPPEPEERSRRERVGLSETQRRYLDTYGYPYVMDEYRFHMTLTGAIANEDTRRNYLEAARTFFEPALDTGCMLDGISLYHEPAAGRPFVRLADYELFGDA